MQRTGSLLVAALGVAVAGCGGGGADGVIKDQELVTLFNVQQQVFTPRCALSGCHVGSQAPFGLDLSAGLAGDNIVNVSASEIPTLLRVEPFNATDSYLYMKLIGDSRIQGDPMPLSGGPLSGGQLALIEDWINQGAN